MVISIKLTLLENFLSSFRVKSLPYHNLYDFTKQLILQNPKEYKLLIISGSPFQSFFFGYLLHKQVGIKWLADYRDEWTTFQDNTTISFLKRIFMPNKQFFILFINFLCLPLLLFSQRDFYSSYDKNM